MSAYFIIWVVSVSRIHPGLSVLYSYYDSNLSLWGETLKWVYHRDGAEGGPRPLVGVSPGDHITSYGVNTASKSKMLEAGAP